MNKEMVLLVILVILGVAIVAAAVSQTSQQALERLSASLNLWFFRKGAGPIKTPSDQNSACKEELRNLKKKKDEFCEYYKAAIFVDPLFERRIRMLCPAT